MINIIAAIDEKRGIGKNNQLLFKISEDLKRFRALTQGHPIIMGRKTFESIGRVLPNRTNIIITFNLHYQVKGGIVVHSLEEAIEQAKAIENKRHSGEEQSDDTRIDSGQAVRRPELTAEWARMTNNKEIFIIGGGQIFTQGLPLADRLYLTIVKGSYDADAFFPDYSMFTKIVNKENHESDGHQYVFLDLEK